MKIRKMKKFIVLAFSCLLFLGLNAQTVIQDKNVEVRNVGSFKGIKVSGAVTVYLSKGDQNSVAASASEIKYRDNIKTEVVNNILVISYSGSGSFMGSNPKLRVYISYTDLQRIEASGATDIKFQDIFKGNSCKIVLSGASETKGTLDLNNLDITLSGASNASFEGRVKTLKLKASGASDFKSPNLRTSSANVNLSGASDASLIVKEELDAKASGASSFKYKGNPFKVNQSASGASSIKRLDR